MNANRLVLSGEEIADIRSLLDELSARFDTVEDVELLREAPVLAHDLPRRVRRHLHDLKRLEPASALCMISGFPIDEAAIGDTPARSRSAPGW